MLTGARGGVRADRASHIQELAPGDRFTVRTGHGSSTFEVIGRALCRRPDAWPRWPAAAAGSCCRAPAVPAFAPNGVVYVDARLVSPVMDAGARWTTTGALPPEERALQADTREVWSLVFALQFLLAAHLGAVWARRRVGSRKTWLVGAPVVALAVLLAADRIVPLLPNVL
ncbi:hypothetical protein BJ979_003422 [Schumannella luteola]|uniref:Sortase n=1 Tax=Schumannella luteola TaxID=472059 RepID=A0A852YCT5_9MICO|nr:hypothetical protein [Schumannella luteola]NYH00797.1 hypothetical protein [Schumannella luteola]